ARHSVPARTGNQLDRAAVRVPERRPGLPPLRRGGGAARERARLLVPARDGGPDSRPGRRPRPAGARGRPGRGRPPAAAPPRGASQEYAESGQRLATTCYSMFLAGAHLASGDAAGANQVLEDALAFAAETGERVYEPELYRLRGECLLAGAAARGRTAAAATW